MKNKVGIFSGTFDPFHRGHLEACLVAKSMLNLSQVLILIERQPKRKQGVTDYKHRFEIIDRSTREYPGLRMVDFGQDNITAKETLNMLTINKLTNSDTELWLIIGSDILAHVETWKDFDVLAGNFHLCVVLRKNTERPVVEKKLRSLQRKYTGLKCEVLPAVWSEVSSSIVRNEIAQSGTSNNLLSAALEYITAHHLYATSDSEK